MILLQVVVSGLLMGSVYALFSSGLTLIWGMMNVVNFAHGDFVMLAMYAAFFAFTLLNLGPVFFIPGAAALLFVLGVVVYLGLVRHVAKGPMLAQILGTFGLALVLRYAAFWAFTANFVSLPDNLVGGTFDIGGLRIEASRLLAGVLALVITLGMHLVLTRTALGSRLLAVAEDRNAAMLMGIRPDRMQALAWGIGAASTGVAGALIALFFYISPTVGESLSLIAFVVVCLGGFGSVPGALIAGLGIGVIEALSAYLIGAVYQDVVVYALFLLVLWVRPQGLLGTNCHATLAAGPARLPGHRRVAAAGAGRVPPAHRRAGAAGGDLRLGVEPAGRLCRTGLGRPCGLFRRRRLRLAGRLSRNWAGRRSPARRSACWSRWRLAAVVGTPTFRLRGHYFSMATIAAAELARILAANWPLVGAAVGLMGPPVPRSMWDLSFISPVPYHYLFLAVLIVLLGLTWQMQRSRMGYYLAAIRGGDRAARSLGVPVLRYKLYALLLSAAFTSLAGSLYAVMVGFIDPDSALGILISVKMVIIAALGGAGTLFGPLVGAIILVPLEETTNAAVRRRRHRHHLHRLRRHHRADRPLPARRRRGAVASCGNHRPEARRAA